MAIFERTIPSSKHGSVNSPNSSSWSTTSYARQGCYSTSSGAHRVGVIGLIDTGIKDIDWSHQDISKIILTFTFGGAGRRTATDQKLYLRRATKDDVSYGSGYYTGSEVAGALLTGSSGYALGCTTRDGDTTTITLSSDQNVTFFNNFVDYLKNDFYSMLVLYSGSDDDNDSLSYGSNTYSKNYLSIKQTYISIEYSEKQTVSTLTMSSHIFTTGTVGTSYSSTSDYVTVSGGLATYSFTYSGTIPPGLTFKQNTSSGYFYFSGTPTTAGTYNFTVTCSDSSNQSVSKSYSITIQNISNTYTITFDGNGNTGGSVPSSISKSGANISVVMGDIGNSVPTKTGYTFRGWAASKTYSSMRIAYSTSHGGLADSNGVSATTTSDSWTYANYCSYTGGSTSNTTLTLYAQWEATTYTVTASAGTGGTISPNGSISVASGSDLIFSIQPNPGFMINYIKIDGVAQEASSTYTFSNITENHTIEAYFIAIYQITSSAGEGGSIEPNGVTTVQAGNSQSYKIKANEGYEILKLVIDGIDQGPHTDYTFSSITGDHTIQAYFEALNYMYIGVENKAKIVENFYLGIDGIAHEIIEGYIGVNNIAKQFYRKIN